MDKCFIKEIHLSERISNLEKQVVDLRRQNTKKCIVFRGRDVPQVRHLNLKIICKMVREKWFQELNPDEVAQYHYLPPRKNQTYKPIIVKFTKFHEESVFW